MTPARFSIVFSAVALVFSLSALLLAWDAGNGHSRSAPDEPVVGDPPRREPPTPPARFYDLIDRIARAEGRLKKLEAAIARSVEEDESDRPKVSPLRLAEAYVFFVEIGAEVPPEVLRDPVEKRTVSGRDVITYMDVPVPAGVRIKTVEWLPLGKAEWKPLRGWIQEGSSLNVVYRRVNEYQNVTDRYRLPPGTLRLWAVSE